MQRCIEVKAKWIGIHYKNVAMFGVKNSIKDLKLLAAYLKPFFCPELISEIKGIRKQKDFLQVQNEIETMLRAFE